MKKRAAVGNNRYMGSGAFWEREKQEERRIGTASDAGKKGNKRQSRIGEKRGKEGRPDRSSGKGLDRSSDKSLDRRKQDAIEETKSGREFRRLRKEELERGQSICRAFGECGGCQMLHLSYKKQLVLKEKETARLLKPYVRLEKIIGMERPEHYRNKVNAAFTHDRQGKPLSGVYKEGTHYIIPINECMLENEKADAIIGSIRSLLPSFKIKTYDEDTGYGLLRHVMVRIGQTTGQIMVVLVLASPILPSKKNFVKALLKLHPDITTIVTNVNERKTSMVLGDSGQVLYGKGYIEDVLCGITFRISPKSFYQVNSVQTEKLYSKAIEYAGLTGRETVLDAYCGIGTIGMSAANKAKRVIGVEVNEDAVKDAVANAKRNQIRNIAFYQKDAGEFMVQLAEMGERVDTVFMDPPRSGSDEVFLSSLVKLAPKKVVYISCNPETLARDLSYMTGKGYRAVKGVCVDMFPFCGHVEVIIMMQHCGKEKN
ncbi:MAG TPA: 23S rRNA (uracil(1939)-C(5))-methyltransferase RlmD [Lachnospiraceae bacterium]|nr:23S rRNA (uracil(1939)-C(5))-methyltransferase RlmD [Lachnospiraceae bacterium]